MLKDYKIEAFTRPVSDLADNPRLSSGELKRHFDSNSYELRDSLNGVIDALLEDDALNNFTLSGKTVSELLDEKADKTELAEEKAHLSAFENKTTSELENIHYYGDKNIYPSDESLFVFELSEDKSYYVLRELSENYTDDITELVIPYEYEGLPVSKIGFWYNYDAFEECEPFKNAKKLKKVILPDSITRMGAMLFAGLSSLEEVRLSENCPLKPATFMDCSAIKEVKLPESIVRIPEECFSGCASLEEIYLPKRVSEISESAFSGCAGLLRLIVPSDAEVNAVPSGARVSLSDVTVEDTLESENIYSALSARQGMVLNEKIGEISLALDELHAYALSLSGGEA